MTIQSAPAIYMNFPYDKLEFDGQICTAPLPPAFMRGVPEGRGEYRTWMQKSSNLEAICPDFWLKRHPGWVGSSTPSVRTGVLRIMVRLPPAIVYYRVAARSTTELWCDCHWQSFIVDSLRGAPPLASEGSKDSCPSVCQTPICRSEPRITLPRFEGWPALTGLPTEP